MNGPHIAVARPTTVFELFRTGPPRSNRDLQPCLQLFFFLCYPIKCCSAALEPRGHGNRPLSDGGNIMMAVIAVLKCNFITGSADDRDDEGRRILIVYRYLYSGTSSIISIRPRESLVGRGEGVGPSRPGAIGISECGSRGRRKAH